MKNLPANQTAGSLTSIEQRQRKDLALYSPQSCYSHSSKIRTVKDIFKLPSKTLGEFKRSYGKDWVIGYVAMWLIELNDNASVKNRMSEAQIEFTAERIYETYSLKITDLTLFFRNVKEGVYGPYYENLSQDKIMQWLSEYWDLRCEYAELENQGRKENFSLSKDKINPEVIEKMFEGVGEEEVVFDSEGTGIGSRMKQTFSIPAGYNSPVQDRKIYLNLLKETCKKASTTDLIAGIKNLQETEKEPDAIAVMQVELEKRK